MSCQCLYSYHQHPAIFCGQLRLNFAVAEVNCPACCGIGSIFVRTAGIDEQHAPAALLRLFRVFMLDGAVPFIGAVVAPDGPEHHIGIECAHFFGSAVRPEVAAQPDGEGFAAIGEFLEVRALAVVGIRLSVVLPADADAAEAVDDLAVRADEGAAAVQGIPVALDEAEGDGGGVLSGSVLQLADGGGIKWESHIAVSGIRPAQAVEALEGGFSEHNEVGTISGGSRVNIIPDYATAGGCFRYYDNETAKVIRDHTFAIAKGVETLSGCKVDVQALTGYACVENDDKLIDLISETLTEELGENSVVWLDEPASGSEDFSYYGLATGTPAALMWLNCEQYTGEETYALHSSKCIFKPEAIKAGAEGFVSIAIKYLNS